jgi:beta-carotene ketolase (CrtW type)
MDPLQRVMIVMVFWVLPLVLSSFQLFLFGTFLPHRSHGAPAAEGHVIQSQGYGHLLSLLACYHFGYHWEHHAYPAVPWFRLPELRRSVSLDHGLGNGSRRLGLAR